MDSKSRYLDKVFLQWTVKTSISTGPQKSHSIIKTTHITDSYHIFGALDKIAAMPTEERTRS